MAIGLEAVIIIIVSNIITSIESQSKAAQCACLR